MVLGQGVSVTVLQRLGLDLESVRAEVRKRHPAPEPGPLVPGTLPTTPRARQTLAHAAQDAKNLGHTYVGTEHILLGLLLEKEGHAAEILKAFGVDPSATRQAILAELAPPPLSQGQTPPPEPGQPG
jgi:ATP-dependent Clp protease ATP-binding subunit ClpC